jgi:hypothetical protein
MEVTKVGSPQISSQIANQQLCGKKTVCLTNVALYRFAICGPDLFVICGFIFSGYVMFWAKKFFPGSKLRSQRQQKRFFKKAYDICFKGPLYMPVSAVAHQCNDDLICRSHCMFLSLII